MRSAPKINCVIVGLIFTALLASCKKTKLRDEMEILAGDWKWIYSEEYVKPNVLMPATLESVIPADSFPHTYEVEFFTNGIMFSHEDNNSTRDRIVVKSFETVSPTFYSIVVDRDNKEKKEWNMNLMDRATDTLIIQEFPFATITDANGRTYIHKNYYARQN